MEAPILIKVLHKDFKSIWHCLYRCYCGNEFIARKPNVDHGSTKSCGCLAGNKSNHKSTHGCASKDNRLYKIWHSMLSRCNNEKHKRYKNYGARGIAVCEEWINVLIFFNWAYSSGYNSLLTIERINNDLGYSPENCKWVTLTEQSYNRSNSIGIEKVKIIIDRINQGDKVEKISNELSVPKFSIINIKKGRTYKTIAHVSN